MNEPKSWAYLQKMTKEEIISFLKQECLFSAPTMKTVQFYIYSLRMDRLLDEHKKWMNENHPKQLALVHELDKLADEYNALNSEQVEGMSEKKLKIINRRSEIWKKFSKYQKESDAYDKKFKAIENVYSKYREM